MYYIFPHYIVNGTTFRRKLLVMKCVFWFSLYFSSEIFLILIRIRLDVINVHRSSCKHPSSFHILMRLEFSRQISKILQIPIFMKILSVEAELFDVDGPKARQRDRHGGANISFSKFCERL